MNEQCVEAQFPRLRRSSMRLPAVDASAVAAVLLVGLTGCKQSDAASEFFALEALRARELTTPVGSRVVVCGEIVREPMRVSQTWDIETTGTWPEYVIAAKRGIATSYRCSSNASDILCSRSSPGDHFQLNLTRESEGPPVLVRARFEARPD